MYTYLRNLYLTGRLSDAQLQASVTTQHWITQAQADQIRADKAAQDADQEKVNQLILDSLEG